MNLAGHELFTRPGLAEDQDAGIRGRDELDLAQGILRRLVRWDPWDLESTLALATVLSRKGRYRKARGLLRQARGLDRRRRFRDVIRAELRYFQVRRRQRA